MKTCPKCNTEKDGTEFGKNKNRTDGLSFSCKVCRRTDAKAYAKTPDQQAKRQQWYQENAGKVAQQAKVRWDSNKASYEPARKKWAVDNKAKMQEYQSGLWGKHREFIDNQKACQPCTDCGQVFPPYVMEYDHLADKKFRIGDLAHRDRALVMEELAKCELVCCACHRVRSQDRKGDSSIPKLVSFRSWINTLKSNPCTDCGRVMSSVSMDFDHVVGEKVKDISDMWSWRRDKVVAEIAKCELVCANCHRERSVQRLRLGLAIAKEAA